MRSGYFIEDEGHTEPSFTNKRVLVDTWSVIADCVAIQKDVAANSARLETSRHIGRAAGPTGE